MNAASAAVGTIDVIAIGVESLGYYVSVCARFRWASLFRSVAAEACEECDDVLLQHDLVTLFCDWRGSPTEELRYPKRRWSAVGVLCHDIGCIAVTRFGNRVYRPKSITLWGY